MKPKTNIEVELSETIHYSKRRERFEAYCPNCEAMTEMATTRIAAILTESTERRIFSLVEAGKIHFVETDGVLICLGSLNGFENNEFSEKDL